MCGLVILVLSILTNLLLMGLGIIFFVSMSYDQLANLWAGLLSFLINAMVRDKLYASEYDLTSFLRYNSAWWKSNDYLLVLWKNTSVKVPIYINQGSRNLCCFTDRIFICWRCMLYCYPQILDAEFVQFSVKFPPFSCRKIPISLVSPLCRYACIWFEAINRSFASGNSENILI